MSLRITNSHVITPGRDLGVTDGVTSFLATGLTRPESDLAALCQCVERYKAHQPLTTNH